MALEGAIQGEIAGKKIVAGSFTPTGGTTAVNLGDRLQVVDAVMAVLETVDLTHMWTNPTISGVTVTFTHLKPTGSGDVTPIAATTPWNVVRWIAIGDAPR